MSRSSNQKFRYSKASNVSMFHLDKSEKALLPITSRTAMTTSSGHHSQSTGHANRAENSELTPQVDHDIAFLWDFSRFPLYCCY
jgi:hypothetical protein